MIRDPRATLSVADRSCNSRGRSAGTEQSQVSGGGPTRYITLVIYFDEFVGLLAEQRALSRGMEK